MCKVLFILCISLVTLFGAVAQDTIYIDPSFTGASDGTIENPYKGWRDFSWSGHNVFLQKRGTTWEGDAVRPSGDNITMGAYGEGPKPAISCTTNTSNTYKVVDFYQGDGITIQNIEFSSVYDVTCALSIGSDNNEIIIDSCLIHDCKWGIRIFNVEGKITIKNCEVYNTADDGYYSENIGDLEIANCYFHHNNDANRGGDCIQVVYEQGILDIHDNILDHSTFGRKFCFILGSGDVAKDSTPDNAYFYNNTCYGFINDTIPTSAIYLKVSIGHLYAYNNNFIGCSTGIYADASTTIYNNVFDGCKEGITITSGDSSYIANNIFTNNYLGLKGSYGSFARAYNNVFIKGPYTYRYYNDYSDVILDYNSYTEDCDECFSGYNLNNRQLNTGDELNSIIAYPNFVDSLAGDYHLRSTSSLIDRGVVIDYRDTDRDGVSLPQGEGYDIGNYEYVVGTDDPETPDTDTIYFKDVQLIIDLGVCGDSIIVKDIVVR